MPSLDESFHEFVDDQFRAAILVWRHREKRSGDHCDAHSLLITDLH
jgi:hypothetical protein